VAAGFRVKLDDSDNTAGWKYAEYEMKGVPVRLEIGPRDIEGNQCVLVARHDRSKDFVSLDTLEQAVADKLESVRAGLFAKACENREKKTSTCETIDEIKETLAAKGDGFIRAKWCGSEECEDKVKELTGVGSRCIPFQQDRRAGVCVCCGKPADTTVLWAKAY